ncbi:DUF3945 domain-containing protein [Chryseobacterium populi]|uniref:DUF3945 domain-containing protein n=1 Tax=Chryseobacterium populi TaxID=1144316 RepID=J3CM80_9FLAO|nr:DUF3945 domain-containing protein [Chryseobacterium populi]EJL74341.1 hypothetical protein PMI13_01080 [Chryseobacterium populi]
MNEENPKQEGASTQEQLSEILLVLDKDEKKIQAVKSISENGELKTVDPTKKNQSQFMRVDLNGDLLTNFFSNFIRQLKDPTRFSFFKVPAPIAIDTAAKMQQQIDNPTEQGKKIFSTHAITNKQQKNQNAMETASTTDTKPIEPETGTYRYQPEQIDWETMANLGLGREKLENLNLLDPLLKGYKINELVPISLNLGTAIIRLDARLSLQENAEGKVVAAIHGIRKEANLSYPFLGHEFTPEDKENLLKTGNMGRIVDLANPKTKEVIPSVISVDRLTNELVAFRAEWIKIPDEIKGIKLNDEQKQILMEGKPLYLKGMLSKKGEPFDAPVQFNADKRYIEFLFDRTKSNQQAQAGDRSQTKEAPRFFREKELDKEQYEKFKEGQTIYVDGLTNKKGKPYHGYITYNKETGETGFNFNNPERIKEQIKSADANKTQFAVNSDGKTNESTKKITEPLKSGQNEPDNNKQKEHQEEDNTPGKGRGRKR